MDVEANKPTVLVVDDTAENLKLISELLRTDYLVKVATNGPKALKIARDTPKPDMILLDIMMPEMDGYEVCKILKDHPYTSNIPVIFITAKSDVENEQYGLELGAIDYITKPICPPLVQARVRNHLALYNQNQELTRQVSDRTQEVTETRLEIIRKLGRAAEFKDNETGMHVIRMSYYSRLIAKAISDNSEWIETIYHAAPMHDIGKIGIPDRVLLKPGKLDADEWEIMKDHAGFGSEILGEHDSAILKMAKEIALNHHEKWDGSGYPSGKKGEEIPLSARIIAVADVFDALMSERPYKKAWSVEDAVKLINAEAGAHFDPRIVEVFNDCLPDFLEIKQRYKDEN